MEYTEHQTTYKSFCYESIYRAICKVYPYGVKLWNSGEKNIYDICDELKPYMVIYTSDKVDRPIKKLGQKALSFNNFFTKDTLIVDDYIYKRLEPDKGVACDTICIAPYTDVDSYNDVFYKYMHYKTDWFRYFGPNRFGGHKDCGNIPEAAHALFLSSAKNVVCLSPQFAMNAYLCNENIVNYKIDKSDVDKNLVSQIVQDII